MQTAMKTIRFLTEWRGRQIGHVDSGLDYGVQQMLVQRGVAEWHEAETVSDHQRRNDKRSRR